MHYYILLDLNFENWKQTKENPFDLLRIFLHALKYSSTNNKVTIINNLEVIYDSEKNDDIENVLKYRDLNINKDLNINVKDIGYALYFKPERILIWTYGIENKDEYVKYSKCMFLAQKHNCIINAFSFQENTITKMICTGTGGVYFDTCSCENLLKLLGNLKIKNENFTIICQCCNNHVKTGLVCPVCLSIYCKFLPVCKKCKTKFVFCKNV